VGQAKRRGTFEQRKQAAIENTPKPLNEEDKQEIKKYLDKLKEMEHSSSRKLVNTWWDRTKLGERILTKSARYDEEVVKA